jgi:hypothetical protein
MNIKRGKEEISTEVKTDSQKKIVFRAHMGHDYKKSNMSTDREKREGKQKGKSDERITESKAQQKEALHCAQQTNI